MSKPIFRRDKPHIPAAMSSTSPTAGRYTVVENVTGGFSVMGPTRTKWTYSDEKSAREHADELNAAYLAGQASREQQWIPVSELQVGERYVVQEAGGHAFVGTYTGGRFEFTMDGSNYVRQVAHSQRITILP